MQSRFSAFNHALQGYGLAVKASYNIKEKFLGLLVCARPMFFILTPVNAASAVVLAISGFPTLTKCLLGFIAVAFASAGINAFNNYIDRERDKHIWKTRPIPSGRVKPKHVFIMVALLFAASLIMTWFFFNAVTLIILFLAILLGCLYSAFFRDKVGYLSLPPIIGLIYLGGWSAFSPETLLTSFLPWYLYLLGLVWQTAHILVLYPVHIPEDENISVKPPPVFFFTPSPKVTVIIGVCFTLVTLIMSLALPFLAQLGTIYVVIVVIAGIYALITNFILVKDPMNRAKILRAFSSLSLLRLTISAAILVSVLISTV